MKMEAKMTLGLLFAFFVQAAGGLVWAGAAAERIDALERSVDERRPVLERMARVEAELSAVRHQLDRMESHMGETK